MSELFLGKWICKYS